VLIVEIIELLLLLNSSVYYFCLNFVVAHNAIQQNLAVKFIF